MSLTSASTAVKLRSITAKFDAAVKATVPFYSRVCTVIRSGGYDEQYGMLGSVPSVREWLADRKFHSVRAAHFTLVNKLWESSLAIPKTDIEDDRLNLYGPLASNQGVRAARHPDKLLLSDIVVNGTTNLCLDGQAFFDTDHAWGDSGTQDNDLTSAIVAAASPTVDEFYAAVVGMLTAMLSFVDDHGELLHDDAVFGTNGGIELVAVGPLKYWSVAKKVFTPGIAINSGETNVPIVLADYVPTPHVTGNYFDLYRVDTPIKPYVFQARSPLKRQMKGMDDMEFKDVKLMTEARYNLGYAAWWNAVRHTFTTA